MATIIKHTRLNIRDKKACKRPISHLFLRVFLQAWSSVSERKGGDRQTPTVRTGEREGRGNFGQSRGKVEDSVDKREHREGKWMRTKLENNALKWTLHCKDKGRFGCMMISDIYRRLQAVGVVGENKIPTELDFKRLCWSSWLLVVRSNCKVGRFTSSAPGLHVISL